MMNTQGNTSSTENLNNAKAENMTNSMKLMEAMNGIRREYIEAAGMSRKTSEVYGDLGLRLADQSKERQEDGEEIEMNGNGAEKKKKARIFRPSFYARIAAAAVAVSIILPNTSAQVAFAMQRIPVIGAYFQLVTFRNYSYEDEGHNAEVSVSGVSVDEQQTAQAGSSVQEAAAASAAEINQEIQDTTDSLIEEFKDSLKEEGYSTLDVKTETVTDNDKWYVIKLSSFQAQADGYEENRYYVISRKTGKRVELADLFQEGSDYKSAINDEIIRQMREKENEDPDIRYFLDDEDTQYIPDAQFTGISDDQQFYINNNDELVIVFQEGEVAAMYMGVQEFVIPDSVVSGMLTDV